MLDALADLLPAGQCPAPLPLAHWHQQDPCPVLNAVMRANLAAPHLTELARFLLPRLPHGVLASSTIKGEGDRASSRVIRLEEAVGHRWISYNTDQWTNCETVDIDEAINWRERLAEMTARGLPEPAFATLSPWKGTVHLTWVYDRPIRNSDPEQVRIRRGIKRGLCLVFGADRRFANRLTKNPWHRGQAEADLEIPCGDPAIWAAYQATGAGLTYHTEIMDLRPVAALDLLRPLAALATERQVTLLAPKPSARGARPPVQIPNAQDGADQKGSRLFHAAARAVRRACTGQAPVIHGIVERTAAAFRSPAGAAEIAQIAENITKWMNTHWWGPLDGRPGTQPGIGRKPVDVGVMTGEAADTGPEALADWRAMDATEKRQAAGKRSRAAVAGKNDEAIRQAIAELVAAGETVTQALVAARAAVGLKTVKRRWHTLALASVAPHQEGSHGHIRPCGPRRGLASFSSKSENPSSSSLTPAQVALRMKRSQEALKRERAAALAYRRQAARMLARGAEPEAVFPPPPGSSATLREAHAVALAAQATARRRSENRRKRLEAVARAADRDAWHAEHAGDSIAWEARLADLGHQKAMALERILRAGGDQGAIDRLEMAFASMFAAEHRARRRAQGDATPDRKRIVRRNPRVPINRPDEVDLLIPW